MRFSVDSSWHVVRLQPADLPGACTSARSLQEAIELTLRANLRELVLPSGAIVQRVLGSAPDWRIEELAEPEALTPLTRVRVLAPKLTCLLATGMVITLRGLTCAREGSVALVKAPAGKRRRTPQKKRSENARPEPPATQSELDARARASACAVLGGSVLASERSSAVTLVLKMRLPPRNEGELGCGGLAELLQQKLDEDSIDYVVAAVRLPGEAWRCPASPHFPQPLHDFADAMDDLDEAQHRVSGSIAAGAVVVDVDGHGPLCRHSRSVLEPGARMRVRLLRQKGPLGRWVATAAEPWLGLWPCCAMDARC